jgi:pimeloyl-ACP methyl ester carboxylesterase
MKGLGPTARRLTVRAAATLAGATLCLALSAASPSGSLAVAGDVITVPTSSGPGPARFNQVQVRRFGPKRARRVLVLMPGTAGGAGNFTPLARDLVRRVPRLAVWAADRRSQALEETEMFERALAGDVGLEEMFDHYLGWITNGGIPTDHFRFLDPAAVPFTGEWGMRTALRDIRSVVRRAQRGGRKVLLGGHSLGASLTAAYAAWDFNGRPGFRDLDGLVLIDGGLLGSFDAFDLEQAKAQLATLAEQPFLDLLGLGIPEAAGLFAEAGAIFALREPRAPATTLQSFPLLPPAFNPPVPVTNRALIGHAFDRDTSPEVLRLLHVNGGGLAPDGEPRDWLDGGLTPVARVVRIFAQEPTNGVEWYFPRRLTIDVNAANALRRNEAARFLGLRLQHARRIDVPIYAFQTDLTDGRVLRGARRLVRGAKTRRRQAMLIDGSARFSHLDPLTAAPESNRVARTVSRFIRSATR